MHVMSYRERMALNRRELSQGELGAYRTSLRSRYEKGFFSVRDTRTGQVYKSQEDEGLFGAEKDTNDWAQISKTSVEVHLHSQGRVATIPLEHAIVEHGDRHTSWKDKDGNTNITDVSTQK